MENLSTIMEGMSLPPGDKIFILQDNYQVSLGLAGTFGLWVLCNRIEKLLAVKDSLPDALALLPAGSTTTVEGSGYNLVTLPAPTTVKDWFEQWTLENQEDTGGGPLLESPIRDDA